MTLIHLQCICPKARMGHTIFSWLMPSSNKCCLWINATSSCGVYSRNRLKKHTTIIALIAVKNFEWTRHKSFWMYQFWCWENISNTRSFYSVWIAVVLTCKFWNLEQYKKITFKTNSKTCFWFLKWKWSVTILLFARN